MPLPAFLPLLLRAGAFGALQGGHPGNPAVGITVPIQHARELEVVLETLDSTPHRVTLLIPPALVLTVPELLHKATQAGHEVAGMGQPEHLPLLEAGAMQPLQFWAAEGLSRRDLHTLASQGIRPLPFPLPAAELGQTLRLSPEGLTGTLNSLRKNGFKPVPVSKLPDLRQGTPRDLLFHLYQQTVEERFTQEHHVIDLTGRADAVMRVAALDHAPAPLPLPPGTPTAELHLHSTRLVGMAGVSKLGTYRAYQRSLKDVAQALHTHPELQEAQAVFAVTLFHGPLETAGFHMLDLPPWQARWYGLGFRLLRIAYGTTRAPSKGTPRMACLGREEFLAKFG